MFVHGEERQPGPLLADHPVSEGRRPQSNGDLQRGTCTVDQTNQVEKIPAVGQEVLDVRSAFGVRNQSLN